VRSSLLGLAAAILSKRLVVNPKLRSTFARDPGSQLGGDLHNRGLGAGAYLQAPSDRGGEGHHSLCVSPLLDEFSCIVPCSPALPCMVAPPFRLVLPTYKFVRLKLYVTICSCLTLSLSSLHVCRYNELVLTLPAADQRSVFQLWYLKLSFNTPMGMPVTDSHHMRLPTLLQGKRRPEGGCRRGNATQEEELRSSEAVVAPPFWFTLSPWDMQDGSCAWARRVIPRELTTEGGHTCRE